MDTRSLVFRLGLSALTASFSLLPASSSAEEHMSILERTLAEISNSPFRFVNLSGNGAALNGGITMTVGATELSTLADSTGVNDREDDDLEGIPAFAAASPIHTTPTVTAHRLSSSVVGAMVAGNINVSVQSVDPVPRFGSVSDTGPASLAMSHSSTGTSPNALGALNSSYNTGLANGRIAATGNDVRVDADAWETNSVGTVTTGVIVITVQND